MLPYLETEKQEEKEKVSVPNITGMTFKEAKKLLQELELDIKIYNEQENLDNLTTVIKDQTPKEGITLRKGEYVVCEVE